MSSFPKVLIPVSTWSPAPKPRISVSTRFKRTIQHPVSKSTPRVHQHSVSKSTLRVHQHSVSKSTPRVQTNTVYPLGSTAPPGPPYSIPESSRLPPAQSFMESVKSILLYGRPIVTSLQDFRFATPFEAAQRNWSK